MERRLYERIRPLLPNDEEIKAAIVVFTGPGPGWGALGPFIGVVGALLVFRGRKFFTIAITNRGVVQFKNSSGRKPAELIARLDLTDLGPLNDTDGDPWVELAGRRYWMEGMWSIELMKMRRLLR